MSDTKTVIARYLAVGGAHVTVARGGADRCTHTYAEDPCTNTVTVDCEACGELNGLCLGGFLSSEDRVVAEAMAAAETHAQTCRRLPKRLWFEGGAR